MDSDNDGNGEDQTNISNNPASGYSPAFYPDGTQIAFGRYQDENAEIYAMDSDGSNQINVSNSAASDFDPDWQVL